MFLNKQKYSLKGKKETESMNRHVTNQLALKYKMLAKMIYIFLYNNVVKDECRTAEALRLTTRLAEVVCCKLMMYLRKTGTAK